uniref:VWFA domain-containing protein n=1 Tax=Steinernema glaseri TaxID=37863 RepID=A0A1I8A8W5_9BILA
MRIQPRHATYVALAVAALLLIAGAVMLGIGVSKLNKANDKKCETSPATTQASEVYFQALVPNVNPDDLSSDRYQNVSSKIRSSLYAALSNSDQQPSEVTILLVEPSIYDNGTAVVFASAVYSSAKAPTNDDLQSQLANVTESVYSVKNSKLMSLTNNFDKVCKNTHASNECTGNATTETTPSVTTVPTVTTTHPATTTTHGITICPTPAPPACSLQKNVVLMIDTSNDMSQLDFNTMLSFLAHDFVTQWPLDKFNMWVTASPNEVSHQA